jgi:hypothetical protein
MRGGLLLDQANACLRFLIWVALAFSCRSAFASFSVSVFSSSVR